MAEGNSAKLYLGNYKSLIVNPVYKGIGNMAKLQFYYYYIKISGGNGWMVNTKSIKLNSRSLLGAVAEAKALL